jgi:hypothetical protein
MSDAGEEDSFVSFGATIREQPTNHLVGDVSWYLSDGIRNLRVAH